MLTKSEKDKTNNKLITSLTGDKFLPENIFTSSPLPERVSTTLGGGVERLLDCNLAILQTKIYIINLLLKNFLSSIYTKVIYTHSLIAKYKNLTYYKPTCGDIFAYIPPLLRDW